jgi:hypothetical protein
MNQLQEMPEISSATAYITTTAETGDHRERRIVLGNQQNMTGHHVVEKVLGGLKQAAEEAEFFEEDEDMSGKRLVRVFVVDPDEAIDIDKSLLYDSKEKMTDLDDQELFFEIEIKELLAKHNEYRGTVIDKDVKERTEHLEPIRIRELKMTVVTLAEF